MQHILGQVRRCVEDYHMIEAGDKVAVGVSGGKDSLLTLTALARLRDFYPIPFQVEAITLETIEARVAEQEGTLPGLGLLPFSCKRFDFPPETALKIPHMGWDRTYVRIQTPLTEGLEPQERYYYVHSYHAACEDPALVLMECEYGYRFPSAVYGGSVYGVQFHPEKSHLYGMKLLKNFAERC